MLNEEMAIVDGAVLARSIRSLAGQARRAMMQPMTDPDVRALLREIGRVERQLEGRSTGDLARWVASLRRRVKMHGLSAV